MNDYVRENKVDPVPAQLVAEFTVPPKPAEASAAEIARPAPRNTTDRPATRIVQVMAVRP